MLYGREGCHLCDAAREKVEAVCAEQQVAWAEFDVDADPTPAPTGYLGNLLCLDLCCHQHGDLTATHNPPVTEIP